MRNLHGDLHLSGPRPVAVLAHAALLEARDDTADPDLHRGKAALKDALPASTTITALDETTTDTLTDDETTTTETTEQPAATVEAAPAKHTPAVASLDTTAALHPLQKTQSAKNASARKTDQNATRTRDEPTAPALVAPRTSTDTFLEAVLASVMTRANEMTAATANATTTALAEGTLAGTATGTMEDASTTAGKPGKSALAVGRRVTATLPATRAKTTIATEIGSALVSGRIGTERRGSGAGVGIGIGIGIEIVRETGPVSGNESVIGIVIGTNGLETGMNVLEIEKNGLETAIEIEIATTTAIETENGTGIASETEMTATHVVAANAPGVEAAVAAARSTL